MKHTYEQIEEAFRLRDGGKYRLLLQRQINGLKCRAYARIVLLDDVEYWNVDYEVKDHQPIESLVKKMFDIISEKIDMNPEKFRNVVLWRY